MGSVIHTMYLLSLGSSAAAAQTRVARRRTDAGAGVAVGREGKVSAMDCMAAAAAARFGVGFRVLEWWRRAGEEGKRWRWI